MALVLADRVREASTSIGTGALVLTGAISGYQAFSTAIGNTNTTYYGITNTGTAEWEVGLGTVSAGLLTRTTVLASSNGGAAVTFTTGTKDVFCTYPAGKSVNLDSAGALVLTTPLPVTSGGTGLTAVGTSGNVLTSNGTTWASTAPAASGITTGKAIAMAMIFGF
tara:strand:- start:258 stop:755 length:498 start_codon:yes stop_codon:yes gene_type:complete